MNNSQKFTLFNSSEQQIMEAFQKKKDVLLRPLLEVLVRLRVKPAQVTFWSFMSIFGFVLFYNNFAGWALTFIVLGIILDLVDGSLARFSVVDSKSGALLDTAADNLGFFIVVLTLIYFGTVGGFLGALYVLSYVLMVVLLMTLNAAEPVAFFVFKSKYFLYLFLFIFVIFQFNFLDPFLVFCTAYMIVTNIFLFQKLRWAIK